MILDFSAIDFQLDVSYTIFIIKLLERINVGKWSSFSQQKSLV